MVRTENLRDALPGKHAHNGNENIAGIDSAILRIQQYGSGHVDSFSRPND
jgi:hypothetical protein